MKLTSTIDTSTPDVYYDLRFRTLIEQHLDTLRTHRGNSYLNVDELDLEEWRGNLYGYLYSQRVPVYQHWIIMRLNHMDSTLDFSEEHHKLILPHVEYINRLRELFNTVHKI